MDVRSFEDEVTDLCLNNSSADHGRMLMKKVLAEQYLNIIATVIECWFVFFKSLSAQHCKGSV